MIHPTAIISLKSQISQNVRIGPYCIIDDNVYLDEERRQLGFNSASGIPIKPIGLCGRIGVSTFRFIVSDMTFEPVIEERSVVFDK